VEGKKADVRWVGVKNKKGRFAISLWQTSLLAQLNAAGGPFWGIQPGPIFSMSYSLWAMSYNRLPSFIASKPSSQILWAIPRLPRVSGGYTGVKYLPSEILIRFHQGQGLIKNHSKPILSRSWAKAIGQSSFYALQTSKESGIVLILERIKDRKHWIRLNTTIQHFELPIDTWSAGERSY
jgi:hypothetical protein